MLENPNPGLWMALFHLGQTWNVTLVYSVLIGRMFCLFRISARLSDKEGFPLDFNPLNPHDAPKHHFVSVKNDLFFLHLVVLERQFS